MIRLLITIGLFSLVASCSEDGGRSGEDKQNLFQLLDNQEIGINFSNDLSYDKDFNVYTYRNFYNGGGVAIGDVNNDGLEDVYLVSNQGKNKLYINRGNWKFEDVSNTAGVGGDRSWSTGVTMVDINADGYLDIYVCNSGDVKGDNKENELFINNKDLTFTESAEAYGLNDKGFSTHASFFDYDKDGDLDVYILNNSFQAIGSFNLRKNERPVRNELGGDKLMKNENGTFVDASEEAGIYGSVIGFGLGITVGDVNNDQWEDIFISNDFFERDYLYINQKDGTFKEDLTNQMQSISGASMGADIGDMNNDGYNDLFITEMLPYDYERLKSVTTFENWDRYQYGVKNDYYHQFTRNTFQVNNQNGTFSESSRFAGIDASDWSWGALFFDMNNDGLKDLFIANGIYRDLTDQDYLQYIANESVMKSIISEDSVNYKKLIDIIPSNPVKNHAYINQGNLNFKIDSTTGLMTPSFSNGSAYGDLDNDGDLDLIVNNVNMPAFFYQNHTDTLSQNTYLQIDLTGDASNTNAIGAIIKVSGENQTVTVENQPARGFQSSMSRIVTVGLGLQKKVELEVTWPSGKVTKLKDVATNQRLTLSESEAVDRDKPDVKETRKLVKLADSNIYNHQENRYNDFNREQLIYHMLSTQGPCVSKGDLNGDGKDDLFVPGTKGVESSVLLSKSNGMDRVEDEKVFLRLQGAENLKCELFDADGDGDQDIYVTSGGTENSVFSDLYYDRLLINDGKARFSMSDQTLPMKDIRMSSGAVTSSDIDGDGDTDIFVGERVKVGNYGQKGSGYILINDGTGQLEDHTSNLAPTLKDIGMITDAKFIDIDNDGDEDLVIVGEFMPITVMVNEGGKFIKKAIPNTNGWWNTLEFADIDGDGDQDLIAGNHGLNSRFKATEELPIRLFYHDYDNNGFGEGILTKQNSDGKNYPYALRHNLMKRLPMLNKVYPDYHTYKSASISDMFAADVLSKADVSEVTELRTMVFRNDGGFNFSKVELPYTVQLSPIYAIQFADVNKDGHQDILMGGNLYNVQPEVGRYDASFGHLLINDGNGNFSDRSREYGFSVKGEIRDIVVMEDVIHIFRNNDSTVSFKIEE